MTLSVAQCVDELYGRGICASTSAPTDKRESSNETTITLSVSTAIISRTVYLHFNEKLCNCTIARLKGANKFFFLLIWKKKIADLLLTAMWLSQIKSSTSMISGEYTTVRGRRCHIRMYVIFWQLYHRRNGDFTAFILMSYWYTNRLLAVTHYDRLWQHYNMEMKIIYCFPGSTKSIIYAAVYVYCVQWQTN